MFNIVLYSPQIPPNTGVAARLCAATGARLHLIRPLGFRLDDAAMRRAGLDYWDAVNVTVHDSMEVFLTQAGVFATHNDPTSLEAAAAPPPAYLVTKHGRQIYTDVPYPPGSWLIFGSETRGLPPDLLAAHPSRTIVIPMREGAVRSLNLASSVSIVLYEALRQNGFPLTGS